MSISVAPIAAYSPPPWKVACRSMWHSIRRKWATERKGYTVKDAAAAGGWKTEETLVTSYQQPDAETVRNVVLHPTHRIVGR